MSRNDANGDTVSIVVDPEAEMVKGTGLAWVAMAEWAPVAAPHITGPGEVPITLPAASCNTMVEPGPPARQCYRQGCSPSVALLTLQVKIGCKVIESRLM